VTLATFGSPLFSGLNKLPYKDRRKNNHPIVLVFWPSFSVAGSVAGLYPEADTSGDLSPNDDAIIALKIYVVAKCRNGSSLIRDTDRWCL